MHIEVVLHGADLIGSTSTDIADQVREGVLKALGRRKCLVEGCLNHDDEGRGRYFPAAEANNVEWVCMPCWHSMITGKGRTSQVFRNVVKELVRGAI